MLRLPFTPAGVWETNMLEEPQQALAAEQEIPLTLRPFEIKTIKVSY